MRNKGRMLLVALCIVALLLDFAHIRHGYMAPESWWGFYGVFAFCASVAVVTLSSWLRRFLQRPPNYYEDRQDD